MAPVYIVMTVQSSYNVIGYLANTPEHTHKGELYVILV